jgi:hypothetical protein
MLQAIHINSTVPFRLNNKTDYNIDDFDILTTVLSALMWRKLNGNIKLYTDNLGKDYYTSLGLLDLWDTGINTSVLENMPSSVNQQIYWASAKIFALQVEKAPVVMLDTDMIVWKDLSSILCDKRLSVIHRENLMEDIYLPKDKLKTRQGYHFDPDWDWTELPCNASFAYFGDNDLKNYYTKCSIDFMTGEMKYPNDMISQMVYAEQRLMAMCAKKMNISVHHFLDEPYQKNNHIFTHLWGVKSMIRSSMKQRTQLCKYLLRKIELYFPYYYHRLRKIELLTQYYNYQI